MVPTALFWYLGFDFDEAAIICRLHKRTDNYPESSWR